MAELPKHPNLIAYTVSKSDRSDDKGFWTRIGAAWSHKDGDGMTIKLEALPLHGEIVLRRPKDDQSA
jgi:hypothetical protein